MKKFGRFISLIGILALVLAATAAWAQPGMGPGGGQGRGGTPAILTAGCIIPKP
jgi:hypothetical protein